MVLCFSLEIASLKIKNKKLAGPPVYYSGSNEPSLAPRVKWLDNTFKHCPPRSKFPSREDKIVDKDPPNRQLVSREGGERAGGGEMF